MHIKLLGRNTTNSSDLQQQIFGVKSYSYFLKIVLHYSCKAQKQKWSNYLPQVSDTTGFWHNYNYNIDDIIFYSLVLKQGQLYSCTPEDTYTTVCKYTFEFPKTLAWIFTFTSVNIAGRQHVVRRERLVMVSSTGPDDGSSTVASTASHCGTEEMRGVSKAEKSWQNAVQLWRKRSLMWKWKRVVWNVILLSSGLQASWLLQLNQSPNKSEEKKNWGGRRGRTRLR